MIAITIFGTAPKTGDLGNYPLNFHYLYHTVRIFTKKEFPLRTVDLSNKALLLKMAKRYGKLNSSYKISEENRIHVGNKILHTI